MKYKRMKIFGRYEYKDRTCLAKEVYNEKGLSVWLLKTEENDAPTMQTFLIRDKNDYLHFQQAYSTFIENVHNLTQEKIDETIRHLSEKNVLTLIATMLFYL